MAQNTVASIIIKGNIKTKDYVIFRELEFEKNERYSAEELSKYIYQSEQNLVNLNLFNFIEIIKEKNKNNFYITIILVERWYFLPYPIMEISERNFNTWWNEFSDNDYSDFSRLNYGVFLNWENFRGENQILRMKIRKGFKEHYLLAYEVPYFDRKKTIGINTNLQFFRRKKTHFKSYDNKLKYFESNTFSSIDYDLNTEIIYRNNIHQKHKLKLSCLVSIVSDSIIILNSNYLNNTDLSTNLFSLSYQFEYEKRDYIIYPLNGHFISFEIKKYLSYSVPHIELLTNSAKHFNLTDNVYAGSSFKTKYSTEGNQPYFIQKGLGFEDYVRGYEYYVIDGQSYWISKSALKYELIEKKYFEIPYMRKDQFKKSHYSLYFSIFSDLGYVIDNQNQSRLNNELLWGSGISLDYVTYYDKLLRIEYTINRLGEKGVFLHFSSPF